MITFTWMQPLTLVRTKVKHKGAPFRVLLESSDTSMKVRLIHHETDPNISYADHMNAGEGKLEDKEEMGMGQILGKHSKAWRCVTRKTRA